MKFGAPVEYTAAKIPGLPLITKINNFDLRVLSQDLPGLSSAQSEDVVASAVEQIDVTHELLFGFKRDPPISILEPMPIYPVQMSIIEFVFEQRSTF